jgi:hypothetical protein
VRRSLVVRLAVLVAVVAAIVAVSAAGIGPAWSQWNSQSDADSDRMLTACAGGASVEVVGCWNGVEAGDKIALNQSDGLTNDELRLVADRGMARVEQIRNRPFKTDVPVEVISRTAYRQQRAERPAAETFNRWNDQVWKALFVIGEGESAADVRDATLGGAVAGFYSPTADQITIVTDGGSDTQIDPSTLIHELSHAMQDQYYDLTDRRYSSATKDGELGINGLIEGTATQFEEAYQQQCSDEWRCLSAPAADDSGDRDVPETLNYGVLQTVLQPYSNGAIYVQELIDGGSWGRVDELWQTPPESSAAVISRTPDYETTTIAFEDTATGGWEQYPSQGVDGAETVGEASMFVMLWYQALEYGAETLEPTAQESTAVHTQPDTELDSRVAYNYDHPMTDGWAGDALYPYRDDTGDQPRDGYVWVTEWQTTADAVEFLNGYQGVLEAHDVVTGEGGTLVINEGPFRGAYGIDRTGTTVRIAHGPTPTAVAELRPGIGSERALITAGAETELSRLRTNVSNLSTRVNTLHARITGLSDPDDDKLAPITAAATTLQDQLSGLDTSVGQLSKRLTAVESSGLNDRLRTIEKEIAAVADRIDAVQSRLVRLGEGGSENTTRTNNTNATPSTTEQPQSESSADGVGTGFGVVVAAAALIGTAVVARRYD